MSLEDMAQEAAFRFRQLPPEEQNILREWKNSDSAMVLRKVLGPEMSQLIDLIRDSQEPATPFIAAPRGLGGED
jgi:hypothetical protein